MTPFDRPRNKNIKRNHSWKNGFNTPIVEKPNYEKMLLSTEEEIQIRVAKHMEIYQKAIDEFKRRTSLTTWDMGILLVAAMIQTLRWVLLSNDKMRFSKASEADKVLDSTRKSIINSEFLPATLKDIAASTLYHTVPYDATMRSARFQSIYPEFSTGLSGTTHRFKALGHDPIAGLLIGTANIATNTLTVNEFSSLFPSYHVVNQQIDGKTDLYHVIKWTGQLLSDKPEVVGAAFIRQIVHSGTDAFTKQGLPIPIINVVSPETSKFLVGEQIDTYSVIKGATLSIMVNKIVEMCHRTYFNPNCDDPKLYEVRTRKILMYSNTLSSMLNIGYVGLTRNVKKLDVGGILVTLWRLLSDKKKIEEIQYEFVNKTLDNFYQKEEDEINQQLAKWGFSI